MVWYPILGSSVFFLGVIISLVLYFMKRKWHPVLYVASICIYIFAIGFSIDVFNLDKNAIMGLLFASSLLMIAVGFYISKTMTKTMPATPTPMSKTIRVK